MGPKQSLNEEVEQIESEKQEQARRAAAIFAAVEVESAFKLYSYRIIPHGQFIAQITEIAEHFLHELKKAKNA